MLRALVAVALLVTPVAADGVYFGQSIGIGTADEPSVGRAVRTRACLGARVRWLAIEQWITSDTQTEREGAWHGIGGEPAKGRSDLAHYGVDVKAIARLHRTPSATLEGYVRTGASVVTANGELDGYGGYGLGVGGGVQLRGSVRALGLLWGPLFFVKRGPKVMGALWVDQGYERVRLRMADASITTHVHHLTLGFAFGSSF